jgi:K+-sensing histidine kinase KdpD
VTSDRYDQDSTAAGFAVAGLLPILVAGGLVAVRGEVDSTNLALVLVVVVVFAAMLGGRAAGAMAAVVSAISFDFFLTRPYLSLHIDSADDVETMIFLLLIGLLVGELVTRARRANRKAARGADEVARLHRVAELAAGGAEIDDLVLAVEAELTGLLDLTSCRFEPGAPGTTLPGVPTPSSERPSAPELPRLERNGAITGAGSSRRFVAGEFALPADGVQLPVLGRGRELGRLVLVPDPHSGASLEERVVAVALSDQLGAAIAAAGTHELGTKEN